MTRFVAEESTRGARASRDGPVRVDSYSRLVQRGTLGFDTQRSPHHKHQGVSLDQSVYGSAPALWCYFQKRAPKPVRNALVCGSNRGRVIQLFPRPKTRCNVQVRTGVACIVGAASERDAHPTFYTTTTTAEIGATWGVPKGSTAAKRGKQGAREPRSEFPRVCNQANSTSRHQQEAALLSLEVPRLSQ